MKYQSTRGQSPILSFEEAVLQGLAPDGGLYIPQEIPTVPLTEIFIWSTLSFAELATKIFRPFISSSEISDVELLDLCTRSYSTFSHPEVTPITKLPNLKPSDKNLDNVHVLELFHGPTFAFKDVALQFVGNLFEFFLTRKNKVDPAPSGQKPKHWITVVGATSGDTGGAAIYGLRGKKNVNVFILHPKNRISKVQEQQMTTVLDDNVVNISVEGTFDDCQETVKAMFGDENFRRTYNLAAINSINWARILAQTTYYFYSFFRLLKVLDIPVDQMPSFSSSLISQYVVPTGNFGDILAGYIALRMQLPITTLVIATNENDILHRFLETGTCRKPIGGAKETLSPAMDIIVSSNFERLLWYLARGDDRVANAHATTSDEEKASEMIREWMQLMKTDGKFTVSEDFLARARSVFKSRAVSNSQTADAIKRYYHNQFSNSGDGNGYVLDPHTAVAVVSAESILSESKSEDGSVIHTICLSTASPGKFPDAVLEAINEKIPTQSLQSSFTPIKFADFAPKELVELEGKEKRCVHIETFGGKKEIALEKVKAVIVGKVDLK